LSNYKPNNSKKPIENKKDAFASYIRLETRRSAKKPPEEFEKTEPLVFLSYEDELKIKSASLKKYLADNRIKSNPANIIPSPLPRKYRTTSKRKVYESKGKFYLLFADESYVTHPEFFRPSLLEPDEHGAIFEYLINLFNQPGYIFLARALNFLIIRGGYKEFSLIFNINKINADVIKKLKIVSEKLKESELKIISVFSYYDPTKSEYYFESERPEKEVAFKKFFGPDYLFLKLNDKKFSYHPTSFSQINESIIPLLVNKTKELLKPDKDECFFDLYCGYGLFACNYSNLYSETWGIEAIGESVRSAALNAKYLAKDEKIKFIAKRITAESLEKSLPGKVREKEVFLLDPPRNGTEKGVIEVIAERNPYKIVHIFCSVDEIPKGIGEWEKCGYKLKSLTPLDLFPGSPNLEVIALLER